MTKRLSRNMVHKFQNGANGFMKNCILKFMFDYTCNSDPWRDPDSSFEVLFHSKQTYSSWTESSISSQSQLILSSCTLAHFQSSAWGFSSAFSLLTQTSTLSQVSPQVPVSSWALALTSGPTLKPLCRDSSLQSSLLAHCFYLLLSVATKQSFPLTVINTGQAERRL